MFFSNPADKNIQTQEHKEPGGGNNNNDNDDDKKKKRKKMDVQINHFWSLIINKNEH